MTCRLLVGTAAFDTWLILVLGERDKYENALDNSSSTWRFVMAASRGNFPMLLLIIVSTVLPQASRASRMWRRCEALGFLSVFFFLITGCSLAGLLLLDSVQISPNNDAISVCQCEHPLLFTAGHSKSRALATTIWCSEEPSRCLMTSASLRINMDCRISHAPPPLDASGSVCCCAVVRGSWRTFPNSWLLEVYQY